jgi:hypothetical protein
MGAVPIAVGRGAAGAPPPPPGLATYRVTAFGRELDQNGVPGAILTLGRTRTGAYSASPAIRGRFRSRGRLWGT